ncbi:prevent-host-death family protein [Microbacterium sp. SORGH_AS 1204]|uniref:type II toxin-antitoxin system Phd/YefM family antitoxin n=1 Tax=Microbacterium sp. SORGH_AS_1204 TaxID=3041785 RepID=UPI002793F58A|nr:type II toxin-antitoxin system Phd/YefM family antitoxin [Microbacterium sp. SORGH_AS_1204]MDQ1135725.1 prevent-host-death family protein [Microbacterium sp. SORGH_AS_1204]
MADEVPVSEARGQLSELVNRVRFGGESIVLTRHGKGVAALVPIEHLSTELTQAMDGESPNVVIDLSSRSMPIRQSAAHSDPDYR